MQKKLMQKRSILYFTVALLETFGNQVIVWMLILSHFFRSKDIPIAISYKKGGTQVI